MKTLLVVCALLIQGTLYACGGVNQPVYAGKIEYHINPVNPFNCTVTITLDFDINEALSNDSIWVYWGDYLTTIVYATSITEDTVASLKMNPTHIYTHVYSGSHTYATLPAAGYYQVSFQNQYRINGLSNIVDGDGINVPFYLVACVGIDTTANTQNYELAFPTLGIGFAGFTDYRQNGGGPVNAGGDSVSYNFFVPLESIGNTVPEYLYPDQYCVNNGFSPDSFSLDPLTGDVRWASPCSEGIFCYGTTLNRYKNARLVSSIMREQDIYVSPGNSTGIKDIAAGAKRMIVYPNPIQNNILSGTISISRAAQTCSKLEIIAPDGRVLYRNIPVTDGRFETDISGLAAGIYFVHEQGLGGITQKFAKQ